MSKTKVVPCWICKGKGKEQGEIGSEGQQVAPDIICELCEGDGMIEIGSKRHKEYKQLTKGL